MSRPNASRIGFILPPELREEMADLGQDEPLEPEPDGLFRAREAEHGPSAGDAGDRPGKHRGRADLLEGQGAEQLAETVEPKIEQRLDGLRRAVPGGDPRAAG